MFARQTCRKAVIQARSWLLAPRPAHLTLAWWRLRMRCTECAVRDLSGVDAVVLKPTNSSLGVSLLQNCRLCPDPRARQSTTQSRLSLALLALLPSQQQQQQRHHPHPYLHPHSRHARTSSDRLCRRVRRAPGDAPERVRLGASRKAVPCAVHAEEPQDAPGHRHHRQRWAPLYVSLCCCPSRCSGLGRAGRAPRRPGREQA